MRSIRFFSEMLCSTHHAIPLRVRLRLSGTSLGFALMLCLVDARGESCLGEGDSGRMISLGMLMPDMTPLFAGGKGLISNESDITGDIGFWAVNSGVSTSNAMHQDM